MLPGLPVVTIGAAVGFVWTEVPFAEGAFIGTVLLGGIAANDSVLLTDPYR